ncbi:MAG: response regulator [Pyrinomonadaceae bacterium]
MGTGRGLSTVYGILKQSGGNIWVYSEPGVGTTFKIYLSRVDEPREAHQSEAGARKLPRGTETILLVEDEELVRRMTREILEMGGYEVLEAPHGGAALALGEQRGADVDLLITGVVMPGMNGRELAQAFQERHPEVRVLYMSGYADDAIVRHGVLDAGTPFLQKPFTPDALANKVREDSRRGLSFRQLGLCCFCLAARPPYVR